jgi:DNA-binding PadR family transcriptional regulator
MMERFFARHCRRTEAENQSNFPYGERGGQGRGAGLGRGFGKGGGRRGRGEGRGLGMGRNGDGSCRRRGSGSGRLLNHGELRLLVLHMIAAKPRHGYDLIREIEELSGGIYMPSPGIIYPTLTFLEELGYVVVTVENNKKMYSLTPQGQDQLSAHKTEISGIEEALNRARQSQSNVPTPSIVRAMENVHTALQLRLAQGPMDQETSRQVAQALDSIALIIEQP